MGRDVLLNKKYSDALIAYEAHDHHMVIELCSEIIHSKMPDLSYGHDELMVNVCALRRRVSLELFKQTGSINYHIMAMEDFLLGRYCEKPEPGEKIVYVTSAPSNPVECVITIDGATTNHSSPDSIISVHSGAKGEEAINPTPSPESVIKIHQSIKNKAKVKAKKKNEKGDDYLKAGDYATALNCYTESIHIDSENLRAYQGRIKANMYLGHREAALNDCAQIIHLDYVEGNALWGFTLVALGEYEQADVVLSNLILKKSNLANNGMITLRLQAAKIYRTDGQLEKAKKYILDAWIIDTECSIVGKELGNLGRTYQLSGMYEIKKKNYQQAKLYFDQAILCSVLMFKESLVDALLRVMELFKASTQDDIARGYLDIVNDLSSKINAVITPKELNTIIAFGSSITLSDLVTLCREPKNSLSAAQGSAAAVDKSRQETRAPGDLSALVVNSVFKHVQCGGQHTAQEITPSLVT